MTLNSRTAPQKSFGRRESPAPGVREAQPPAPKPVQEMLKDAEPQTWLSEMVGNSIAEARFAARPDYDLSADELAPRLDVGHVVGRSLAVLAKNPVTFLSLFAVIALPEQTLAYLPVSLGLPPAVILPVFTILGCMALYAASFAGALASLKGGEANLDSCLRALVQTPRAAYAVIAMTVSSLSLMLILPAVGFAGRWALAAPVALAEGRDARVRSQALTAPYRAQIRLLVVLVAAMTLLRGLLAVAFADSSLVNALSGDWLFAMLLTMLVAVAGAVLYRELVPASPPA